MYAKTFPTDFSVEGFVAQETPVTFGLFNEAEARKDLNDLFKFPTDNKDAMPFYVFSGTEANHAANVSDGSDWYDVTHYIPCYETTLYYI